MSREELANRALTLRALRELITAEEQNVREQMAQEFRLVGQREVGAIGGKAIGSVQLIKGTSTWTVDDSAAWLSWVEQNHPDEIVPMVRPSFTTAMITKLRNGGAEVDEETGELEVPAGIVPRSSAPSLRVTPTKDAPGILLQAMGEAAVLLGLAVPAELEAS